MKILDFYFDPVSPYAYLAFEQLPQALQGHSYVVRYCPVLLGGLLQHWGQLEAAEVPPKRLWTYRHVLWQAQEAGVAMQMPTGHPFHSVELLHLLIEYGLQNDYTAGDEAVVYCNRFAAQTVLRHVWNGGYEPLNEARFAGLRECLGVSQYVSQGALRERIQLGLRSNTSHAAEQSVFGVPSVVSDGILFWGLGALPMLTCYLQNPQDPVFTKKLQSEQLS